MNPRLSANERPGIWRGDSSAFWLAGDHWINRQTGQTVHIIWHVTVYILPMSDGDPHCIPFFLVSLQYRIQIVSPFMLTDQKMRNITFKY